jgi:hypothetical protein
MQRRRALVPNAEDQRGSVWQARLAQWCREHSDRLSRTSKMSWRRRSAAARFSNRTLLHNRRTPLGSRQLHRRLTDHRLLCGKFFRPRRPQRCGRKQRHQNDLLAAASRHGSLPVACCAQTTPSANSTPATPIEEPIVDHCYELVTRRRHSPPPSQFTGTRCSPQKRRYRQLTSRTGDQPMFCTGPEFSDHRPAHVFRVAGHGVISWPQR